MKERPILFSAPMVRAILDGSKTQTRRIVKMKPWHQIEERDDGTPWPWMYDGERDADYWLPCPYGQPGDRLWVREAWQHSNYPLGPLDKDCVIFYRADYFDDPHGMDGEKSPEGKYRAWKPSIHMPRWASRILLEIIGVRVERLNDISEEDASAEGCERLDFDREERDFKVCPQCGGTRLHNAIGANMGVIFDVDCTQCNTYKKRYRHLWESINGPGSWDANPWVWAIEFKVVKP